jgi:acyl carrier protein
LAEGHDVKSDSRIETTLSDLHRFILRRFLPGEDPARLTPDTPLISSGLVDSLGVLEMISFLEDRLDLEFEAHEADRHELDTLQRIEHLLRRKLGVD